MKAWTLASNGSVVKPVPKNQIGPILNLFDDSRLDLIPMKWVVAYGIEVETAGQKIPVTVFFTHGGAGAFSVNGRYYTGGTDKAFENGIGGLFR